MPVINGAFLKKIQDWILKSEGIRKSVCEEFGQVGSKIEACQAVPDSARSQNVLSGLVG